MASTETYSLTGDFPNQQCDPAQLSQEIEQSSIVTPLEYINVAVSSADNVDIVFASAISGGEKTTLDGIVAVHDGYGIPYDPFEDHIESTSNPHDTSASNLDGYIEDSHTLNNSTTLVLAPDGYGGLTWMEQSSVAVFGTWKEPTGIPSSTRADSVMSVDDGTRTFTIQPTGASYSFLYHGVEYTKYSADNVVFPDTEGIHYFYFDSSQVLQTTMSASTWVNALLGDGVLLSAIYWDAANNDTIFFAEERHGLMPGDVHLEFHNAFGAKWVSPGGQLTLTNPPDSSGDDNDSATFAISSTTIYDEDIRLTFTDGNPQEFDPIAQIPVYYLSGANAYWRKKTANNYPVIYSGTAGYTGANGRLPYNQFTGTTWQLTEVTNNDYVLVHYFVTNDLNEPIIGIQGQVVYTNIFAAQTGAEEELNGLYTSGLPTAEFAPLASVIFQTSSGYTNAPKARIRSTSDGGDYVDWRYNERVGGSGGGGVTVHGALLGLDADDHTHYLLIDGSRAMTGALDMDGYNISNAGTVNGVTVENHSARHENGGSDEISIAGLSGEAADAQKISVSKNSGATVGTRSSLNFVEGSNITLTIADDAGGDEVDITIAASGGADLDGYVVGPDSATDNYICVYDGITGKLIQQISGLYTNDSAHLFSEQYIMGSGPDMSLIPVSGGQSVITSWHGLQLVGNKQSTVEYTPSNVGTDNQFGVVVPSQDVDADASFAVVGASSQTGDLIRALDNSLNSLLRVDISGHIHFGTAPQNNGFIQIPSANNNVITAYQGSGTAFYRLLSWSGTGLYIGQDVTAGDDTAISLIDIESSTTIDFSIAGSTAMSLNSTQLDINTVAIDMNNQDVDNAKTVTFNSVIAHGSMGTTETIDWTQGQKHSGTNSANCTITFTAPAGPCNLMLVLTNPGAYTLTWPASVRWPGGAQPSWTASGVDIVAFFYNGTYYYGVASRNFA